MNDGSTILVAPFIGQGVALQSPTSAPGSNGQVPSYDTDATFAGWVSPGGGGAFTADADTLITPTTAIVLDQATGNEAALTLNYTVNKDTSGNDTGLLISMTDTASPGTSVPLDIQVGGSSKFAVDNTGAVGIGTTTPSAQLDILAPASTTGLQIMADATPGSFFKMKDSGSDVVLEFDSLRVLALGDLYSNESAGVTIFSNGGTIFGAPYNNFIQKLNFNNNFITEWFRGTTRGDNASAIRAVEITDITNNYGKFHWWVRGSGGFGTVMTLDYDNGFAIGGDARTAAAQVDILAPASTTGLLITTNSAAANPAVKLDQQDIDDSFIDFAGTSAADGSRSISSSTGEAGACFGKIRIEINGVTKWIRVYDDHT